MPSASATSQVKDTSIPNRQCVQYATSPSVSKRDIMLEVDDISSTSFMDESKPDVDGLIQSIEQESMQGLSTKANITRQGSLTQSNEMIWHDSGVIQDTLTSQVPLNMEENAIQESVRNLLSIEIVINHTDNASFDASFLKVLDLLESLSSLFKSIIACRISCSFPLIEQVPWFLLTSFS